MPRIRQIRCRATDERGVTLVELLVTMMILSIVSLVFTTMLTSVQRAVVNEGVRTRALDDARLAVQSIDRQVRSGNLLYSPAAEADPYGAGTGAGYMIRVYTQANAPTEGSFRCALWLIDNQQQLKYRSWPALQPLMATAWRIVAENVVNRTKSLAAFSLDATNRTLTVKLYVNADYTHQPNATQLMSASLTGRNTSFGYPQDVCEELPTT